MQDTQASCFATHFRHKLSCMVSSGIQNVREYVNSFIMISPCHILARLSRSPALWLMADTPVLLRIIFAEILHYPEPFFFLVSRLQTMAQISVQIKVCNAGSQGQVKE